MKKFSAFCLCIMIITAIGCKSGQPVSHPEYDFHNTPENNNNQN